MQSDAVLEAEWRAANRAALKCEEIARIYQQHGGPGGTIAVTALAAAASAIRKMADELRNSGTPSENGRG